MSYGARTRGIDISTQRVTGHSHSGQIRIHRAPREPRRYPHVPYPPRLRLSEAWPLGLLICGALALHGGAIGRPFFADDYLFLEQVRGRSFFAALLAPDPLGNFFRPVGRALYFWLVSRAGGETPSVFHAVNLALFAACLLVFNSLATRLVNRTVALAAVAFVALHYAADVPLRWASGSQDLLSVLFATLAALWLTRGRVWTGTLALLLSVLAKEVGAGALVVAMVATLALERPTVSAFARRFTVPTLALVAWAAWLAVVMRGRASSATGLSFSPSSLAASAVHLLQVAFGLEFRLGGQPWRTWSLLALLPVALAILALALGRERSDESVADAHRARAATWTGLAWAIVGALPVALVAPIWSAYFYLWALLGVGLLVGVAAARVPLAPRLALVGGLVLLSAQARGLDEFAVVRSPWTFQSHVNRHYVDRALGTIREYLAVVRHARPVLAHRSTVFFADVPVSSSWQTADGPLLRWAYRDSSLRSYFLGQFTRARAERGPVLFFAVENGTLVDRTDDPGLMRSLAFSQLLADKPLAAIDVVDVAEARWPKDSELRTWRAWARWQTGDTLTAARELRAVGLAPLRAPAPAGELDVDALVARRSQAALDPWVHARLAARWLGGEGDLDRGVIEAYAYHVLSPDEPDAWRKWASAQLAKQQYEPALASLRRYQSLAGPAWSADREAQHTVESLERLLHGDVANRDLR